MLKNTVNITAFGYQSQIYDLLKHLTTHMQNVLDDANYKSAQDKLYLELVIHDFSGVWKWDIDLDYIETNSKITIKSYRCDKKEMWIGSNSINDQEKWNNDSYTQMTQSLKQIQDDFDTIHWNDVLTKFMNLHQEYTILGTISPNKEVVSYSFYKLFAQDDLIYYLNNQDYLLAFKDEWVVLNSKVENLLCNNVTPKITTIDLPKNLDKLIKRIEVKDVRINNNLLHVTLYKSFFADFNKFAKNYHETPSIIQKIKDYNDYYPSDIILDLKINNINSLLKLITNFNEWKKRTLE